MPVTEISRMGIKPNLSIIDPSTPEGAILLSTWRTIMSLPGGPSRVYWGVEAPGASGVESTSPEHSTTKTSTVGNTTSQAKLWTFFDWPSIAAHEEFAVVHGANATQSLPLILTHSDFTKHISPSPTFTSPSSPIPALRTKFTHLLLLSFPSNISDAQQSTITHNLQSTLEGLLNSGHGGIESLSTAWGVEQDFPLPIRSQRVKNKEGEGEIETGAVCVVFIGWEDADACRKVMGSKEWEEGVQRVRGVEGLVGFEAVELRGESLGREEESGGVGE